MARRPLCFVISPIGEAGSTTRQDADDLLELIIRPALDIFDLDIIRGDHRSEANQIDVDVIKSVQEAEVCIADISQPNVNVFYEVGRRDETGRPLILLKSKNSGSMPVDLGTRRYIEYDLDSRRGIGDARQQLRNFVEPLANEQFQSSSAGSSMSDIAATLQRVERKLDRLMKTGAAQSSVAEPLQSIPAGSNPKEVFQLARKEKNVPLMEACLDHLRPIVDRWKFLDFYVEITAAHGSIKAGEILLENASDFMDETSMSFHNKVDYLSYLITFAIKTDREQAVLELVEEMCERLLAVGDNEDPVDLATIHNQKNRLYYGIYISTRDMQWLHKAVACLHKAEQYAPDKSYIPYNLALCYKNMEGKLEEARACIDRVLALDAASGQEDSDHLETGIQIYRKMDDPAVSDLLERLAAVNPVKARLLASE